MSDDQGNVAKNYIYAAVLGLVGLVAAVLLLKMFVFTGTSDLANGSYQRVSSNSVEVFNKQLKLDFFNDQRFQGLRSLEVELKKLPEIELGLNDPFAEPKKD